MNNGKAVIAEVGVGPVSMAYGKLIWDQPDTELLMFEPHPIYYKDIVKEAAGRPNVKIHNVAIGDENGTAEFYEDMTSSFLAGIDSPSVQANVISTKTKISVQVRKISDFDFGQIDYLRLDTEGAEWFTLKHLISRPRQIVVEMYNDLATYINPYLHEIEDWAKNNNYVRTAINSSDFIYTHQ